MNQVNIVFKRVLVGIVETCDNSRGLENFTVVIEAVENIVDSLK